MCGSGKGSQAICRPALCEEFLGRCEGIRLGKHVPSLIAYIRTGKYAYLESIPGFMGSELQGS